MPRRARLARLASLLLLSAGCGLASRGTATDAGSPPSDAGAPVVPFDAGADAGTGELDGALPPPHLGVTAATVYAGTPASLVAQVVGSSADLTYAWSLVGAPQGSGVTSASIGGATTLTATVPTDAAGAYTLAFTATSGASVVAASQTTVTALAAPVIYVRTTIDTGGGELALVAVGHDGTDSHAVACPSSFYSNQDTLAQQRTMLSGASLLDVWEAPPGEPSKYALAGVTTLTADDAGDYAISLFAGTSATTCATAPTALAQATAQVGALGQPRFSPDGSRVAFLEPLANDAGVSFGVATIGFDGSSRRAVAPIYAGGAPPDGGADESSNIRVEWRDATTLAWAQPQGNGTWALVTASDVASATPQALFVCAGTTPHHLAFPGDGTAVAAFSPAAGAPVNLFVLAGAAGPCTVVRNLTHLVGPNSRAHDFALSPDGAHVAFLRYDSQNDAGDPNNEGVLSLVPIDGSASPAPIGAPVVGRIGPRWIAAGSRLAWTRTSDAGAAPYANAVTVIQPDGGGTLDLAVSDGTTSIVAAAGPGGSCSITNHPSGSPTPATLVVVALLGLARRRRRVGISAQ